MNLAIFYSPMWFTYTPIIISQNSETRREISRFRIQRILLHSIYQCHGTLDFAWGGASGHLVACWGDLRIVD